MSKYFMGDIRLEGLERMMMLPPKHWPDGTTAATHSKRDAQRRYGKDTVAEKKKVIDGKGSKR